jgi:hypothetical protein
MATTTLEYKLFLYPERTAMGAPLNVLTETYNSLEEARRRGAAFRGELYEIQCISTTTEPPSKKFPNGDISSSKTMMERKQLYTPLWWRDWLRFRGAREGPPELRFQLGYGYLRLRILSREDAIKILVLTRGCGAGLYYDQRTNNLIIAKSLRPYSEINKILKRAGYCDEGSS